MTTSNWTICFRLVVLAGNICGENKTKLFSYGCIGVHRGFSGRYRILSPALYPCMKTFPSPPPPLPVPHQEGWGNQLECVAGALLDLLHAVHEPGDVRAAPGPARGGGPAHSLPGLPPPVRQPAQVLHPGQVRGQRNTQECQDVCQQYCQQVRRRCWETGIWTGTVVPDIFPKSGTIANCRTFGIFSALYQFTMIIRRSRISFCSNLSDPIQAPQVFFVLISVAVTTLPLDQYYGVQFL